MGPRAHLNFLLSVHCRNFETDLMRRSAQDLSRVILLMVVENAAKMPFDVLPLPS